MQFQTFPTLSRQNLLPELHTVQTNLLFQISVSDPDPYRIELESVFGKMDKKSFFLNRFYSEIKDLRTSKGPKMGLLIEPFLKKGNDFTKHLNTFYFVNSNTEATLPAVKPFRILNK